MSHNKISVGSATPDANGNITVGLGDLSDINLSNIAENEVLKYNGTNWINSTAPAGTASYIWVGGSYAKHYGTTPLGYNVEVPTGGPLYFYTNNEAINTISGSSLTITDGWLESITLPAGSYLLQAQTMMRFQSSGYMAYCFETTAGTRVSQFGVVGDSRGVTYGPSNSSAIGHVTLTEETTLEVILKAQSGLYQYTTYHGNYAAEFGLIYIEAL